MTARAWQVGRRRVPVLLQERRADCGHTALAMIMAGKGHRLDRRRAAGSRGTTLAELAGLAGRHGFLARAVALEPADLGRLCLPAILHWDMNHFVVLVRRRGRRWLVHDPAIGARALDTPALCRSFTGVALEVRPAALPTGTDDAARPFGLFRIARSIHYLPRYLAGVLVLLLCVQLLNIVPAVATQLLIDQVVLAQDTGWLWRVLAGTGAVMLLAALLDAWRQVIALHGGTHLAFDTGSSATRHLLGLPLNWFDERDPGNVLSRLRSLIPVNQAISDDAVNTVVHTSVLVATVAVMCLYSTRLTLVAATGLLVTALVTAATLPPGRRLTSELLAHRARQDDSILASIRGIRSLRVMGRTRQRFDDWQRHHARATNTAARYGRLAILAGFLRQVTTIAEQLAFLGIGIADVVGQRATLGILFAFMALRGRLFASAGQLAELATRLAAGRAHAERLSDILLGETPAPLRAGRHDAPIDGRVRASRLAFAYPGAPFLFEDVHLDIAAGEHVAVLGPSGCGKSTLLALLSGERQPARGTVFVDGVELDLWSEESLRRQVVLLLQDDQLFDGSIADNISGFDERIDVPRLRDAAAGAGIWQCIRELPMREETPVAAATFSGGERQRLLLARAFYRRPKILLLDEATRSLDPAAERHVLGSIARLGCTTIHVTHREAAARCADRLVDFGRLVSRPG